MRYFFWLISLGLLSFNSFAQVGSARRDDCSPELSNNDIRRIRSERSEDSIAGHIIETPACTTTLYNAIPSGIIKDMRVDVENDHLHGFFSGVANADHYLVIISEQEEPCAAPVNGLVYKPGDLLGNGRVVSNSNATAFIVNKLVPSASYYITVFGANANSSMGLLYSASPIYKGKVVMKSAAGMNYYFGNLHSHSSYSDGNKDNGALIPSDDYAYARNSLCMDFLGISEHNHFSATNNPGMHLADYQLGIDQANQFTANNPGFLALYGMEWGVINNGGHVLIYGVDSLIGWETLSGNPNYDIFVSEYDYTGAAGLFRTVSRFAYNKAFASFAHPANTDYDSLRYINFDTAADNAVVGCAVESGPAFSTDTTYSDDPASMGYLTYYRAMLAKGYHIGPFVDQDNHYLTFGRETKARLAVLAPSLNKSDFFDAMRAMHFYATELCDTKIDMDVSGQMMGSIFSYAGAPSISVSVSNVTNPGTPDITIYKGVPGSGINATAIATNTGATFSYTDNTLANDSAAYYYADIVMNGKRSITAPVWYTRNDSIMAVKTLPNLLLNHAEVLGNPVQDGTLHLAINAALDKDVKVKITDITGRLLVQRAIQLVDRNGVADICVSGFAAGSYIVTVQFSDESASKLFIKQ